MKLFGYNFTSQEDRMIPEQKPIIRSFVSPDTDDGAREYHTDSMYHFQSYALDIDKSIMNIAGLVNEYRATAMIPDVDLAIEDIVNESIVTDENSQPVKIILDKVPISDSLKQTIEQEFEYLLGLLKFPFRTHDIFKRFYVDGQINYHKLIDETSPSEGIQEVRYIDPRNLVKIREYQKSQNPEPEFNSLKSDAYIEYWVYSETGFSGNVAGAGGGVSGAATNVVAGTRIAKDSIAHCNSGLVDPSSKMILSHLHKAVRIARQLRMLEDSMVILRVTRSAQTRIFKVGVGSLPRGRQEQFMQNVIAKYKNKLTFDTNTGELRDERRHKAAIEDIFIPVMNGQDGTDVTAMEGDTNLGVIADVEMFKQNLYRSLNVPVSRLDAEQGFSLGRSSEITRDEVKYSRFISRLRNRFSGLFDDLLGSHLVLCGVFDVDEWNAIKHLVHYDYLKDNYFAEISKTEVLMNRLNTLAQADEYRGMYFSAEWIKKNILQQTDEEIEEMSEQMYMETVNMAKQVTGGTDKKAIVEEITEKIDKTPLVENAPQAPQPNTHLDDLLKVLTEETKKRTQNMTRLKKLKGSFFDVDGSLDG